MKLYNTLSKQKEEFVPLEEERSGCTSADRPFIISSISETPDL